MYVYVLSQGERCEGSTVVGVYASHRKAENEAVKLAEHGFERAVVQENGDEIWYYGTCDFVKVARHIVIN